jgi:hypothetical protein
MEILVMANNAYVVVAMHVRIMANSVLLANVLFRVQNRAAHKMDKLATQLQKNVCVEEVHVIYYA